MRKFTLAIVTAISLFAGTRSDAAIGLNFSSITDADLKVVGDGTNATISFPTVGNNAFKITGVSGGSGSAKDLFGAITGSFTFGGLAAGQSTATLTSVGITELKIFDGANTLTGTISGINIGTFGPLIGINTTAGVNLSSITYNGLNADLLQLKNEVNGGGGITVLTFQFIPAKTLADLVQAGTVTNSYSGTIATVPEPGSMAMAFTGITMLGLGCYRQHRRKQV